VTITAATGNTFDGLTTIADVNANSQAAGTITTVSITGNTAGNANLITGSALATLNLTSSASGSAITYTNNQSTPTATVLALNLTSDASTTVTDTNSVVKTLNITTSGTASTVILGSFKGTTMTIAGTANLNVSGFGTSLTSLTISGGAGLGTSNGTAVDVSSATKLLNITSSSTGAINLNLAQTATLKQGFVSTGSGIDVITISAQAGATITAGTAPVDMLIWNGATSPSGALTTTGGSITGFSTFGTGSSATGTFNMSTMGTAFTAIDVTGALSQTFSSVTPGTSLAVDISNANTVTYITTGTTGSANSLSLALGIPSADARVAAGIATATKGGFATLTNAAGGITLAGLTLQDAATTQSVTNGIGTLNIVSSDTTIGNGNTITALSDTGLTTINTSGTGALVIGGLTSSTASLTFNNTSSSTLASSLTSTTDTILASLTLTGTGITALPSLTITPSTFTLTQNDTSTTAPVITLLTDTTMSALTIAGSGALTITTDNTQGQTVTGITNNAGALTIGATATVTSGFVNTAVTNLNLSGTGAITITGLTGATAGFTVMDSDSAAVSIPYLNLNTNVVETFMNTGTGTMTVGNTLNIASALTTLTLVGNVAYSQANTISGTIPTTSTITSTGFGLLTGESISGTGITGATTINGAPTATTITLNAANGTVSTTAATFTIGAGDVVLTTVTGASDNANVSINAGIDTNALTLSLGNGTDTIIDLGTAANATLTLGTGSNTVTLGGQTAGTVVTATGIVDTVTFGTHVGGSDTVSFGPSFIDGGAAAGLATQVAHIIAGSFVAGDTIKFLANPTVNSAAPTTQSSGPINGTLATVLASVEQNLAANTLSAFTYGTNTYLVQETVANAATNAGNITVIQIVGSHTFGAENNGSVTLLT
jgi:hypothetical protein